MARTHVEQIARDRAAGHLAQADTFHRTRSARTWRRWAWRQRVAWGLVQTGLRLAAVAPPQGSFLCGRGSLGPHAGELGAPG